MKQSKLVSLLVLLAMAGAFVGFLDATFLTATHLAGKIPACTIGGDCNKVLTSSYASLGSVPTALFGMAYYAIAFLLGVGYIDGKSPKFTRLMLCWSVVGIAASGFLVYVQLGVLRAICPYCMVSALCCLVYACGAVWAEMLSVRRTVSG